MSEQNCTIPDNVSCICVGAYDGYLAIAELVIYSVALIIFLYYSRVYKQALAIYVVVFITWAALLVHLISILRISRNGSKVVDKSTYPAFFDFACVKINLTAEVLRQSP